MEPKFRYQLGNESQHELGHELGHELIYEYQTNESGLNGNKILTLNNFMIWSGGY